MAGPPVSGTALSWRLRPPGRSIRPMRRALRSSVLIAITVARKTSRNFSIEFVIETRPPGYAARPRYSAPRPADQLWSPQELRNTGHQLTDKKHRGHRYAVAPEGIDRLQIPPDDVAQRPVRLSTHPHAHQYLRNVLRAYPSLQKQPDDKVKVSMIAVAGVESALFQQKPAPHEEGRMRRHPAAFDQAGRIRTRAPVAYDL